MQQTFGHASGQSLGEYALTAALVAIVGIGACTFVADSVGNMLPGLTNRIFGGDSGSTATTIAPPLLADTQEILANPTQPLPEVIGLPGPPPTLSTGSVKGSSVCSGSFCVEIPEIQAGPVETAGGLGEEQIHLFSSTLDHLATELEKSGQEPDLAKLIRQLANQGHVVGDSMEALSVVNNKEVSSYNSGHSIMGKLGELSGQDTIMKQNNQQFLALKQQVDDYINSKSSSPQLQLIQSVIALESQQIDALVKGIEVPNTTEAIEAAGGGWAISVNNNAQLTHQSANTICTQQNQTQTCTQQQ